MKAIFITILVFLASVTGALAQCAMCRATLENNVSNGNPGIAAGINFGIMYLFCAPYIAVGALAFFWYKTTKINARKNLEKRTLLR
jgi:hypothetical protein